MNNLKRDNWTNDEVIEIIRQYMVELDGDRPSDIHYAGYNEALENLTDEFNAFKTDPTVFGAMAYNTDTGFIVSIGSIPEEEDDGCKIYNLHQR